LEGKRFSLNSRKPEIKTFGQIVFPMHDFRAKLNDAVQDNQTPNVK
jgi:hypothetical protein